MLVSCVCGLLCCVWRRFGKFGQHTRVCLVVLSFVVLLLILYLGLAVSFVAHRMSFLSTLEPRYQNRFFFDERIAISYCMGVGRALL